MGGPGVGPALLVWRFEPAGLVALHLAPVDAPMTLWLRQQGWVYRSAGSLLLPIAVPADALAPTNATKTKARSLPVWRAYAGACASVFTEEAALQVTITGVAP